MTIAIAIMSTVIAVARTKISNFDKLFSIFYKNCRTRIDFICAVGFFVI